MKEHDLPFITFMVAAYNEEEIIEEKIWNSLELDYPKEKVQYLFVTDGSNDGTMDIIRQYSAIELEHEAPRRGKIAAVNRVMPLARGEITIFSDANAMLNKSCLKNIVRHFQHEEVAAVAGEKRVNSTEVDNASGAGESMYWKYESTLRKWDGRFYSVMGAAGELFAIRTIMHEQLEEDTLIEDFVMTMKMVRQGKRIAYAPDAYAMEEASEDSAEELKRKIRISAGGLQASWRLRDLMNPFKYPAVSFQFLSHRVFRWTIAPIALVLLFVLHPFLAVTQEGIYTLTWILHLAFYALAVVGAVLASRKIKVKVAFVPYYFLLMNYSVFMGLGRLIRGKQSVVWEKAKRKKVAVNP
ncbi:MAG: glycosyltransferase [Bacteroidota bacterium]